MGQTLTLEEAAAKLGITPEEMKRRIREEWKSLRYFRDGPTLRFRSNDVEELARTLGLGSDAELPSLPAKAKAKAAPVEDEALDINLDDEPLPPRKSAAPLKKVEEPLFTAEDDDILSGFNLDEEPKAKAKPTPPPALKPVVKKKTEVDSDVRIETIGAVTSSRGAQPGTDEEIDFDLPPPAGSSGMLSGSSSSSRINKGGSGKLVPNPTAPKVPPSVPKAASSSKSGNLGKSVVPPPDLNSEFELNLEDSDFELKLDGDSDDEVALGEMPMQRDASKRAGESGINIGNPADSGVLLEGKKSPRSDRLPAPSASSTGSDDEIDFELSLESGSSSSRITGPKSKKVDDSEFELSLEDSDMDLDPASGLSQVDENKDIFETDFDIPALDDDSASEALALDEADTDLESSDFDLALDDSDIEAEDESASEVVVLEEDEDEVPAKPKKKRPANIKEALSGKKRRNDDDDDEVALDELDESDSASAALRGVSADDDDEYEDDDAPAARGTAPYVAPQWGVFTVAMLCLGVPVMFFGGLMGYELLHNMWGYQQGTQVASPIVNQVADWLDMKPKQ